LAECDLAREFARNPVAARNLNLIAAADAADRGHDLLIAVPRLGVDIAVDLAAAVRASWRSLRLAARHLGRMRKISQGKCGSANAEQATNHGHPPNGYPIRGELSAVASLRQVPLALPYKNSRIVRQK